jgi:regulator of protease activity HflC (stomatin/prohibitin superfamily)
MKKLRPFILPAILIIMTISFSSCYGGCWGEPVSEAERGLRLPDGTTVEEVVGAGRYKDYGATSAFRKISIAAITGEFIDDSVFLSDKQEVSVILAYTFRRGSDSESIKKMWSVYHTEALDDEAAKALVAKYLPEALKASSTSMTLDQVLGIGGGDEAVSSGRDVMTTQIEDSLRAKLLDCGIELIDVRLSDISPSADYRALLTEKANATVAVEVAQSHYAEEEANKKTELLKKQTELELAQLDIEVKAEENKVYSQSKEAFEIERLKLIAEIYRGMTLIGTPSDATLWITNPGGLAPVVSTTPVTP